MNVSTDRKPLSVPSSGFWDGNDGPWSSFSIQLGQPKQAVRLFVHLGESSTWTVLSEGCTPDDPEDCSDSRGFVFDPAQSSTWKQKGKGLFSLSLYIEQNFGYRGKGLYGFDTVGIGWGNDVPSVAHQVIAGIATKDFYLGSLGLDLRPFNFSSLNHPYPSLVGSLVEQERIPSASWSYTAGSFGHVPSISGSLVLGGYDRNRFIDNGIWFPFGPDISDNFVLSLQQIKVETQRGQDSRTNSTLLEAPVLASINSIMPQLWLPKYLCDGLESLFDLTYDNSTHMYMVSDEAHAKLKSLNPTFHFTLATDLKGGSSIQIAMPYASFDLQLSYPYVGATQKQRYFPIRIVPPDAQPTLGRAFLQNAYIVADYNRRRFSVTQSVLPSSLSVIDEDLVPILPPGTDEGTQNPQNPTASGSSPLNAPKIAGISVGSVVLVVLIVSAFLFFRRRRRLQSRKAQTELPNFKAELDGTPNPKPLLFEPDADNVHTTRPVYGRVGPEISRGGGAASGIEARQLAEMGSFPLTEMPANPGQSEKDGVKVSGPQLHELPTRENGAEVYELEGDQIKSLPAELQDNDKG